MWNVSGFRISVFNNLYNFMVKLSDFGLRWTGDMLTAGIGSSIENGWMDVEWTGC